MGKLSDNISSIYNDYNPAFRNLYKVEIYPGSSEDATEDIKTYIGLHATSVLFNGESINLDRNSVTKNFQLSDDPYQRTNELTISWREDEDWKVKRYHDEWLACFYDKENDHYISRTDTTLLYRTIYLSLPNHNGEENKLIKFSNVFPKTSGGIDLAWGNGGEIVNHSITYYVEKWGWISVTSTDSYYDRNRGKLEEDTDNYNNLIDKYNKILIDRYNKSLKARSNENRYQTQIRGK